MKIYRILETFKGSQTGTDSQEFIAGTEAQISDHLAAAIAGTGWIELVQTPFIDVQGVEQPLPEGDVKEALPLAEDRETKVDAPDETKVEEIAEEKKPGKKKR